MVPCVVACQVPLSMEFFFFFPRQAYWSGLPFPSPGALPDQGLNLCLLHLQTDSLPLSHQESPKEKYLDLVREIPQYLKAREGRERTQSKLGR